MILRRYAFLKLIREDLDWLAKQSDSLEARHIRDILADADRVYYDEPIKLATIAERDAERDAELERLKAFVGVVALPNMTTMPAEEARGLYAWRERAEKAEANLALATKVIKETNRLLRRTHRQPPERRGFIEYRLGVQAIIMLTTDCLKELDA